jgi:hypothetical protein
MSRTIAAIAAGAVLLAGAPALAQATPANPEEAAVRATLDHYLAGHATGDPAEYRQAFDDEAKLFWIRDGKLMQRTDDDYIAGATGKPAPDEARRRRWIESVNITGTAATAKVVLDYPTVVMTDYMSLLKTPQGWKIVNKIFDVAPKPKS